MNLDEMYREGVAKEFAEQVDLSSIIPGSKARVTEFDPETGAVCVDTKWTAENEDEIGVWGLIYWPDYVYGSGLLINEPYQQQGILQFLVDHLPEWWAIVLGLKKHLMIVEPGSDGEASLKRVGFDHYPDGTFGADLGSEGLVPWQHTS